MMNNLSIIVAAARNNAIGKDNQMLWHISADLKHFKAITTGHTVIMGRKTLESIGRPLPKRRNIVITRNENIEMEGVEFFNSLEEAFKHVEAEEEVFVIGGGEIYKQTLPLASKLYFTFVDKDFEADTFFPEVDSSWKEVSSEKRGCDDFKIYFKKLVR